MRFNKEIKPNQRNSFSVFLGPLKTISNALIGITIPLMVHGIFQLSSIIRVFIYLFTFFYFISMIWWNCKIYKTTSPLFFFFKLPIILVFWSRLIDLFLSKHLENFRSHFLRRILVWIYSIWQYGQISISFTNPSESSYLRRCAYFLYFSLLFCCVFSIFTPTQVSL